MIIQCYRGKKIDKGDEISPLLFTKMSNQGMPSQQYFEIIMPKCVIPKKNIKLFQSRNDDLFPAVLDNQYSNADEFDIYMMRSLALSEAVDKVKKEIELIKVKIEAQKWNLEALQKEQGKISNIKQKGKATSAMELAALTARDKRKKEIVKSILYTQEYIKKERSNLARAKKKQKEALDKQKLFNSAKTSLLTIDEDNQDLESKALNNLDNKVQIFKYDGSGEILGIQSYTYKKYKALTHEYVPCNDFTLDVRDNIIRMINKTTEDIKINDGDILGLILIIGV